MSEPTTPEPERTTLGKCKVGDHVKLLSYDSEAVITSVGEGKYDHMLAWSDDASVPTSSFKPTKFSAPTSLLEYARIGNYAASASCILVKSPTVKLKAPTARTYYGAKKGSRIGVFVNSSDKIVSNKYSSDYLAGSKTRGRTIEATSGGKVYDYSFSQYRAMLCWNKDEPKPKEAKPITPDIRSKSTTASQDDMTHYALVDQYALYQPIRTPEETAKAFARALKPKPMVLSKMAHGDKVLVYTNASGHVVTRPGTGEIEATVLGRDTYYNRQVCLGWTKDQPRPQGAWAPNSVERMKYSIPAEITHIETSSYTTQCKPLKIQDTKKPELVKVAPVEPVKTKKALFRDCKAGDRVRLWVFSNYAISLTETDLAIEATVVQPDLGSKGVLLGWKGGEVTTDNARYPAEYSHGGYMEWSDGFAKIAAYNQHIYCEVIEPAKPEPKDTTASMLDSLKAKDEELKTLITTSIASLDRRITEQQLKLTELQVSQATGPKNWKVLREGTLGEAKVGDRVRVYTNMSGGIIENCKTSYTHDATVMGVQDSVYLGWPNGEKHTIPVFPNFVNDTYSVGVGAACLFLEAVPSTDNAVKTEPVAAAVPAVIEVGTTITLGSANIGDKVRVYCGSFGIVNRPSNKTEDVVIVAKAAATIWLGWPDSVNSTINNFRQGSFGNIKEADKASALVDVNHHYPKTYRAYELGAECILLERAPASTNIAPYSGNVPFSSPKLTTHTIKDAKPGDDITVYLVKTVDYKTRGMRTAKYSTELDTEVNDEPHTLKVVAKDKEGVLVGWTVEEYQADKRASGSHAETFYCTTVNDIPKDHIPNIKDYSYTSFLPNSIFCVIDPPKEPVKETPLPAAMPAAIVAVTEEPVQEVEEPVKNSAVNDIVGAALMMAGTALGGFIGSLATSGQQSSGIRVDTSTSELMPAIEAELEGVV